MTGSRIGVLAGGSPEDIYNLWLELTGDPSFTEPDYSNNFAVQLGNVTEQFHLDWIERHAGVIDRRGHVIVHPEINWAAVTLDGWAGEHKIAVETKHTGGFESMDVITERYLPQLHWTMFCTGTDEIIFSVIMGAKEPKPVFIGREQTYQSNLVEEAKAFMQCVRALKEPVPNPFLKPPPPIFTRVVDMSASNSWGAMAGRWIAHRAAVHDYNDAAKGIKKLVPDDAKEAFGHGIRVKRSKTGALTIKAEDGDDETKTEEG